MGLKEKLKRYTEPAIIYQRIYFDMQAWWFLTDIWKEWYKLK